MNNIYGERLPLRFSGVDNLNNPLIKIIFRCIDGIKISDLSVDDKETASKALSIKIIKRQGDKIYPNILIFDRNSFSTFEKIIWDIAGELNTVKDSVINEFTELVKKYVPRHLLGQSRMLIQLTSNMRHLLIEKCIEKGLIYTPDRACCSEGVWAVVEK